jgi:large subunit ribosomal protein L10
MSKNLELKKQQVLEMQSKIETAKSVVIVDYRGLNVADASAMREKMREAGCEYHVYKNRIFKLALNNCGIHDFDDKLEGTLAVAFSFNSEIDAAKILKEFAGKTSLQLKFGLLGKNYVDEAGIKELANLPSKEVLVAKLLGMLNAPMTQLCSVLNGPVRGLTVALNAVATKN